MNQLGGDWRLLEFLCAEMTHRCRRGERTAFFSILCVCPEPEKVTGTLKVPVTERMTNTPVITG